MRAKCACRVTWDALHLHGRISGTGQNGLLLKGIEFSESIVFHFEKYRTDRAWKVAIDSFYKSCLHSKHFICTSARDIYGHVYMHRSHLKLFKVFIQLLLDFRVGITFSVNF